MAHPLPGKRGNHGKWLNVHRVPGQQAKPTEFFPLLRNGASTPRRPFARRHGSGYDPKLRRAVASRTALPSRSDVNENDVLAFVQRSIKSVWALELLLLLRRDRQRTWRPEDMVLE